MKYRIVQMENGKYKIQEKESFWDRWSDTRFIYDMTKDFPSDFDGLFIKYEDAEFVLTNIMFKERQNKEKATIRSVIKVF